MSALVTSTFFPGWPTAATPSDFWYFMLLFGAPLLALLVVGGIGLGLGNRKKLAAENEAAGLGGRQTPRDEVTGRAPQRALDAQTVHEPVVTVEEQRSGAHAAH